VLNSTALRILGINTATSDPRGGKIQRSASGEPTGQLEEKALDLLKGFDQIDRNAVGIRRALSEGSRLLVGMGITCAHNDDLIFGFDRSLLIQEMQNLDCEGKLPIRLRPQIRVETVEDMSLFRNGELDPARGRSWLRFHQMKVILDGSLGGRTAALIKSYSDSPATRGTLIVTQKTLDTIVMEGSRSGFDVMVHAIGDRAIQQAIKAFRSAHRGSASGEGPRGVINHF
jgi:hypothetical protein